MTGYEASSIKRHRRTKAQLADLDQLIIEVIEEDSPVSLRGVYYRVISRGGAPKTEAAYQTIGRRLVQLRRDGQVDYADITDGTRWVIRPTTHDGVDAALKDTADTYRRNLWREQSVQVHIFTEKDAISGVITPVTMEWNVPLGVLRGYCSETFAHEMAQAIRAGGKPAYVYQLGDHDPSGVNAWEDFQRKVSGFIPDQMINFQRLAVTPEQIISLDLPTRPTKKTDNRAKSFRGESVEVDAIPASILRDLVDDAISQHIDQEKLRLLVMIEDEERDLLYRLAGRWSA